MDPIEQFKLLTSQMEFQTTSDALKCRACNISLVETPRNWYRQLTLGSISNFKKLKRTCITQFSARHDSKRPSTHLLTICQRENETLNEYVGRFKAEQIDMAYCSYDTVLSAFIAVFCHKALILSLEKKPTTSFNEVLQRAQKHILTYELWLSSDQKFKRSEDSSDATPK